MIKRRKEIIAAIVFKESIPFTDLKDHPLRAHLTIHSTEPITKTVHGSAVIKIHQTRRVLT